MNKKQWAMNIISRALYVRDEGKRRNNKGMIEDAEKVLALIESGNFNQSELLKMSAYQTVLKAFYQ